MPTRSSKILHIGFVVPPRIVEPKSTQEVESAFVLRHVFEAPFGIPYGTTDCEPRLFTGALRARADGDVYDADVREDAVFSDGVPLTAQDVALGLCDVPAIRQEAEVWHEGRRVCFRLKRPNARFDLALSHSQCSITRRGGHGQLCGTGPYQLADERTPDVVRLTRNPHYRKAVAIDEVHFHTFPADDDGTPTRLMRAIEEGEVDLSLSLGRNEVDAVNGVRKTLLPGVSTAVLYMNCESPRLRDPRLRHAIARAIDRLQAARSSYANPLAFVATSLTPRPLGPADDALGFDLDAARRLLAEAGSVPPRLELVVVWAPRPYLPYPMRIAELVRDQIGQLGIRVEIRQPRTASEYMQAAIDGRHDLTVGGWVADTMDPCDFLDSCLASDRVPRHDTLAVSSNHGRLRLPAMDAALARHRAERSSASLQSVMELVNEHAPLVPLMYGAATAVRSYRVGNFKPSPLWFVPAEDLDLED